MHKQLEQGLLDGMSISAMAMAACHRSLWEQVCMCINSKVPTGQMRLTPRALKSYSQLCHYGTREQVTCTLRSRSTKVFNVHWFLKVLRLLISMEVRSLNILEGLGQCALLSASVKWEKYLPWGYCEIWVSQSKPPAPHTYTFLLCGYARPWSSRTNYPGGA